MTVARALLRLVVRLLGVTLLVYLVLYVTPGTIRVRVVEAGPDATVTRRTGVEQVAASEMVLLDSDCVTAGTAPTVLSHSAEPGRLRRVAPGDEHCVGRLADVPAAYARWLGNAARGQLGYYHGTPVAARLWAHTGRTIGLVLGSLLVGLALALAMVIAELSQVGERVVGYLVQLVNAVSGLHVIVLAFAVIALQWAIPNTGFSPWLVVILAVGSGTLSDYYAILREQVRGALRQDYVQAARGRGASPLRHAVRNEMILGMMDATTSRVPTLIGGTIVVEWVFAYLGLGYDIVKAIQDRDFDLIMGVATVVAVILVGVLEASGLARRRLDPRLAG